MKNLWIMQSLKYLKIHNPLAQSFIHNLLTLNFLVNTHIRVFIEFVWVNISKFIIIENRIC